MSCGNRFQCGITRFQKHSFTPDKPSNPELHNENQKKLSDLLKQREELDKMYVFSNYTSTIQQSNTQIIHDKEHNELQETSIYTPWKIPSAK